MSSTDYADLFNVDVSEVDPETDLIIGFEEERQGRRFVLIPSESIAPLAVRQALGSVFNNIYAEGYPPLRMTRDEEQLVLEHAHQLAYYRRYADRRFYKGVEYADVVETLAQRRCAQCFATQQYPAESIYVNVQPLSGAAANLAVYQTFLEPGDTLMGMNLFQGGHLTHGSEFNLSGQLYNVVSYDVDRQTERLDYDAIMALAREHSPKIIVAGYTSYPWAPDWPRFREIASEVGALLMADIAHTAGMAAVGAYPTPVGYADIITFTTHKTICGPRGAVIMTTDEDRAQRIDAAVFPGEQGGPHVNKFAAMAVAFHIAQTDKFHRLQYAIAENARAFADSLAKRGLRLAYGGTDTHLLLVDVRAIRTTTGFPLRGEMAARILDLCGIVVNRNTIPGDELTALGSAIRMGTPWVTQRGMRPQQLDELADIIARVLLNIQPFQYTGLLGELPRGKIDLDVLETCRRDTDALAMRVRSETKRRGLEYPHFMVVPEKPAVKPPLGLPVVESRAATTSKALMLDTSDAGVLRISGWRAKSFVQQVSTNNTASLAPNQALRTFLLDKDGAVLDDVAILRLEPDMRSRDVYWMLTNPANTTRVKSWLRGLSDGYVLFDNEDVFRKVEGPVVVEDLGEDELPDPSGQLVSLAVVGPDGPQVLQQIGMPGLDEGAVWHGELGDVQVSVASLGYGVGDVRLELLVHPDRAPQLWAQLIETGAVPRNTALQQSLRARAVLPDYASERPVALDLYKGPHRSWFSLTTPYFVGQASLKPALIAAEGSGGAAAHKQEFVWQPPEDAPLRRTPLYEEHRKRRAKVIPFAGWEMPVWYTSVGDEHTAVRSTAGLFDVAVRGEHAASFMDTVASNYARWIDPGQSIYAYLLYPSGDVIDDFIMYRLAWDHYLLVMNAANAEEDLAWLRAVNSREFVIDCDNPAMETEGQVVIRDLKDPSSGADQRVDLALQGPNSVAILQSLTEDAGVRRKLASIRRTDHTRLDLAGIDLIAARTGYTGEECGFELLVHPDRTAELWNLLLEKGAPLGIQPCGLGARDSTRIEAGLPLYGHELAGDYGISPSEAGFAPFVKLHKPFFIGRRHCLENELSKTMEVVRFRVNETGVRALRGGDPVVNKRGQYIGRVTSCTLVGSRQIGLAYVEKRYNEPGVEIGVFPIPHGKGGPAKPIEDLEDGDRVPLHIWATVLTRFPVEEEQAIWSVGTE
jgi:glycine cleavage system T protein